MTLLCKCGGELKQEEALMEQPGFTLVRCNGCAKPQIIKLEIWEGMTKTKEGAA